METYGHVLLIAMPAFLVMILFEKFYGVWNKRDTVENMDLISSLSSGIANITKDVLGLSIAIISYTWMVKNMAVYHVKHTIWLYVIAFIVLDFQGYWVHRLQHRFNFFWNNHMIHHSSEEFNLGCALRQSIGGIVRLFTFFLIPAALLGVPESVIAIVAPIHLFAQFWYHTQQIDKMGVLERIIVTPSHHRVHHAINGAYIDKNFGQIFIFWDKWFGTFQEELKEEPPVYGTTRPVRTWNPIKINFQHLWLLITDAWRAQNWKDKFRIWFMPTGWRPVDVAKKYPIQKIEDIHHMMKYRTKTNFWFNFWNYFQLGILVLLISYLFGRIAYINSLNMWYIYIYGLYIFMAVYALTDLMDRNTTAIIFELIKDIFGIGLLLQQGDWFGAATYVPYVQWILGSYFVLSFFVTVYISRRHALEDRLSTTGKYQPVYTS